MSDKALSSLTVASAIAAGALMYAVVGGNSRQIDFADVRSSLGIPAVSTDNAVPRFDGKTGNLQNSGVLIDDSNNLTPVTSGNGGLGSTTRMWSGLHRAA